MIGQSFAGDLARRPFTQHRATLAGVVWLTPNLPRLVPIALVGDWGDIHPTTSCEPLALTLGQPPMSCRRESPPGRQSGRLSVSAAYAG